MEPTLRHIVEETPRRDGRARLGLLLGVACVFGGALAAWVMGRGVSSSSAASTVLPVVVPLALLVCPVAFAVAAANLTTSHRLAVRGGYALLAGVLSLLLMIVVMLGCFFGAGGHITT